MRVAYLVVLSLVAGSAVAQTAIAAAQKSPEDIRAVEARVADWLKTCLKDWDRATHMTPTEWRTTCHRVAVERRKFLLDEPDAMPISTKANVR